MYDPEIADGSDMEAKIHQYSQEWVGSLNRDDIMSLSVCISNISPALFQG